MGKKSWFYVAIICIIVSIGSLFTSIITYEAAGKIYYFNIIDLIGNSPYLNDILSVEYHGPMILVLSGGTIAVLAVIVLLAIICSVTGVLTLRSEQYPNTWQFCLTIIGLIGVDIPSMTVIIVIAFYGKYYDGIISYGIAPIIIPIAMVICILTVSRRRNKIIKQLRIEMETKSLIRKAGDLD